MSPDSLIQCETLPHRLDVYGLFFANKAHFLVTRFKNASFSCITSYFVLTKRTFKSLNVGDLTYCD